MPSKSVSSGTATPHQRVHKLRVEGEVTFKAGALNLVVGPTASGKSSLLLALLGELHYIPQGDDSWYNLPRAGGVSYAAQEPWIMNESIKVGEIYLEEQKSDLILCSSVTRKTSCSEHHLMKCAIMKVGFTLSSAGISWSESVVVVV